MRSPLPLVVLTVLVAQLTSAAPRAQAIPTALSTQRIDIDSGQLANTGLSLARVFVKELRAPALVGVQVRFAKETSLERGSLLLISSLADGHAQVFEAWSLDEWSRTSAWFNGSGLRVELWAQPMTRFNRVKIASLVGEPTGTVHTPMTICGSKDDRVRSNDPRVARQYPNYCTTWLAAANVGFTAGHCASTSGTYRMQFNVPLSSSRGSVRHPGPADQYPYVAGTLRRLASGVGRDWSVFLVGRNSNHGLYPGERQGSWFKLGTVPAVPATIRITGNGSTSNPRTLNLVQKTHTGPLFSTAATYLRYRTDTTGGNSGSPVIHEQSGHAVGIHTHGGCRSTGTTSANYGTRIDRADLQSAFRATLALRNVGRYEVLGDGCRGSNGVPSLGFATLPTLGRTFKISGSKLPGGRPILLVFGASDKFWGPARLPMPLDSIGMTGCKLYVSFDFVTSAVASSTGAIEFALPIPSKTSFLGQVFFNQLLAVDPGANKASLTASNAAKATIGKD